MNRTLLRYLLLFLFGYLQGGVLFSRLLPKWLLGKDICAEHADGNPGAANVFSSCGIPMGILCLCLDILKGLLPVLAARLWLGDAHPLFAAVMVAPVLGHAFSPFCRLSGGKCISTSFGVLAALLPTRPVILLLAVPYILFSTLLKIPSHRVRSLLSFAVFGASACVWLLLTGNAPSAVGCLLIAVVAMYKHRKSVESVAQKAVE